MSSTIYWHDYETFGADPKRDRPAQFAGIRTDMDLNVIEDPLTIYCEPADDMLPNPEACLITGITPQVCRNEGFKEYEFIRQISDKFCQPNTCVAGYNSIRFDDEVTRNTLYRNFYDPYEREWKNGNSRWDIIDMLRLTHAIRPEGIVWPKRDDGCTSFRLEELTKANGIVHEQAHDAMSDVYATIAIAKLIKEKKSKLYDFVFSHRLKNKVKSLLSIEQKKPFFHVSSKYSAEVGCCAVVAPVIMHPTNANAVIVYDLRVDPTELAELTADEIRRRLFTKRESLPSDVLPIPLKGVHLNKCPAVAPVSVLTDLSPQRLSELQLEGARLRENLEKLRSIPGLEEKVHQVFSENEFDVPSDPDLMLYSGGFFSEQDKYTMSRIRTMDKHELANASFSFDDQRLYEMLMRYKGRNFPELMHDDEQALWEQYRIDRLNNEQLASITFKQFFSDIQMRYQQSGVSERDKIILEELQLYGESIYPFEY